MPDIRIYADIEHYLKHSQLDKETKAEINAKAQQLIYKELDKLPGKRK